MFAIININGSQYRVEENQKVFVPKVKNEIGDKITFDNVIMFSDGNSFNIGSPALEKKVEATVLNHIKDDKIIVFKKKRRKGYKVRNGHRQQYSQILIDKIS
jgi:large subunit ribosomal protein L21